MEEEYNYIFKIVLVGDDSVGKSLILVRFIDNTFIEHYPFTVGVNFRTTMICLNRLKINLQIWDTAGQESFKKVIHSYFRIAHGFFIVFDVTSAESFRSISNWINYIDEHVLVRYSAIIVGNKTDLEATREVSFDEAHNFARRNGMGYIEVSSLTGHNIHQAFELLIREIISKLA